MSLEVGHLEHVGAALRRRRDDLGRVYLDEAVPRQVVAEETADARLDAVDGLVGGGAQVEDAVVEPHVLVHCRQLRDTAETTAWINTVTQQHVVLAKPDEIIVSPVAYN